MKAFRQAVLFLLGRSLEGALARHRDLVAHIAGLEKADPVRELLLDELKRASCALTENRAHISAVTKALKGKGRA